MKKIICLVLVLMIGLIPINVAATNNNLFNAEEHRNTKDILEDLGADITSYEEYSLGEKNVKKVKFNETSSALIEESGKIIQIDRIVENNNKYENTMESALKVYSIQDKEIQKNISYIEKNLIGNEYEKVEENIFDESTVALVYEKRLNKGGYDQYDSYVIYYDIKFNELVSFIKKGETGKWVYADPKISEDMALVIAQPTFDKYDSKGKVNANLTTVKPNNKFSSETINIDSDIRLAYVVGNEDVEVYIDALTGDVIGGDVYKSYSGGANSAPEIDKSWESLWNGIGGIQKLGYSSVTYGYSQNFKTVVLDILNSDVQAFYCCSHGNENVLTSQKDIENPDRKFHRNDVPSGDYKFVFLDACNTGKNEDWANAFGITSGTTDAKAFLGWYESVGVILSYNYSKELWNQLSKNKSVRQAALDAANKMDEYCSIRFYGNRSYNGYK